MSLPPPPPPPPPSNKKQTKKHFPINKFYTHNTDNADWLILYSDGPFFKIFMKCGWVLYWHGIILNKLHHYGLHPFLNELGHCGLHPFLNQLGHCRLRLFLNQLGHCGSRPFLNQLGHCGSRPFLNQLGHVYSLLSGSCLFPTQWVMSVPYSVWPAVLWHLTTSWSTILVFKINSWKTSHKHNKDLSRLQ